MTTTITANGTFASSSCTATESDPCRDHAADLPDGVYEALEAAWRTRGDSSVVVAIGGVMYTMSAE